MIIDGNVSTVLYKCVRFGMVRGGTRAYHRYGNLLNLGGALKQNRAVLHFHDNNKSYLSPRTALKNKMLHNACCICVALTAVLFFPGVSLESLSAVLLKWRAQTRSPTCRSTQ